MQLWSLRCGWSRTVLRGASADLSEIASLASSQESTLVAVHEPMTLHRDHSVKNREEAFGFVRRGFRKYSPE